MRNECKKNYFSPQLYPISTWGVGDGGGKKRLRKSIES